MLDSRGRIGHRVRKRKGNEAVIAHSDECWYQCSLVMNPEPHPWVTYTPHNGELTCDRCKALLILPCPATIKKGLAYLEPEALSFELDDFRTRHLNCQAISQS